MGIVHLITTGRAEIFVSSRTWKMSFP